MIGGGSIQGMITSLRNNKNLLRKKSFFKKEKSFLNLKKEDYNTSSNKIYSRKLTQKELGKIREKMHEEKKSEDKKILIVVLGFVLLFAIGIFMIYKEMAVGIPEKTGFDKKTEKYLFFISDGDKWVQEKNWHNAIFQYKEALKIFPGEFDANYRLALAYSYKCKYDLKDCDKGMQLVERLAGQFPDNEAVKALYRVLKEP